MSIYRLLLACLLSLPLAAADLPTGWTRINGGSASYEPATGTWNITGTGWAESSQRVPTPIETTFVYRTVEGDFDLIVRVVAQSRGTGHENGTVGLAACADGGNSPLAIAASQQGNPKPSWLRLWRRGDRVGAYESAEGLDWYPLNTGAVVAGRARIGMYVDTWGAPGVSSASFDSMRLDLAPRFPWRSTWLANTLEGPGQNNCNTHLNGLAVLPDGTCFTSGTYGEQEIPVGKYRDGQDLRFGAWWLRQLGTTGMAITARDDTVWVAKGNGFVSCAVAAPGFIGQRVEVGSRTARDEWTHPSVRGLAVNADASEVFVANVDDQRIDVFRGTTRHRSFAFARPGALAWDPRGRLWAVQEGWTGHPFDRPYAITARIVALNPTTGAELQSFTGPEIPVALACDSLGPNGARLLVADNGLDQQVKLYDATTATPTPIGRLGAQGGMRAGVRGQVADAKLNGISGLGTDAAGRIYVCTSGWPYRYKSGFEVSNEAELLCFPPSAISSTGVADATAAWKLQCTGYIVECASLDDATGDVYVGADARWSVDWNRPVGQEARREALLIDHRDDPDEMSFLHNRHCQPVVRWIAGQRFVFQQYEGGGRLSVLRFEAGRGEQGVPCLELEMDTRRVTALVEAKLAYAADPASVWWLLYKWDAPVPVATLTSGEPSSHRKWEWRDGLGGNPRDGRKQAGEFIDLGSTYGGDAYYLWIDRDGGLWCTDEYGGRISYRPCTGLANGVPQYGAVQRFAVPPEFLQLGTLHYDAATDRLTLSGDLRDRRGLTTGFIRYHGWLAGERRAVERICLVPPGEDWVRPNGGEGTWRRPTYPSKVVSWMVAGDLLFAGIRPSNIVRVFDLVRGNEVERILAGPERLSVAGFPEMPMAISAHLRPDGSYTVLTESNESLRIGMHRWTPEVLPTAPGREPLVQGHAGDGRVDLDWRGQTRPVGVIDGYRVYRSATRDGSYADVSGLITEARFGEVRANGAAGWYRVACVNANGEGPRSTPLQLVARAPTAVRVRSSGRFDANGWDATTRGDWLGVYGSETWNFAGWGKYDVALLARPNPPQVFMQVFGSYNDPEPSSDPKLPRIPYDAGLRLHRDATFYDGSEQVFRLGALDGRTHRVALYAYQNGNRLGMRLDFVNPATGAVVATDLIRWSDADAGRSAWFAYDIQGRLDLRVNPEDGYAGVRVIAMDMVGGNQPPTITAAQAAPVVITLP